MNKSRNFLSIIPNTFTLLNLLAGCIAIILAIEGKHYILFAGYLILISAFLDFIDGFSARLLKASSDLGKYLDSLADLVSFGIAPATILYQLIRQALNITSPLAELELNQIYYFIPVFLIMICSGIRLAIFNSDDSQKLQFKGLATPITGLFIASLPIILTYEPDSFFLIKDFLPFKATIYLVGIQVIALGNVWVLFSIGIIFSLLMILPIPMFSLKFRGASFKNNSLIYIFLIISLIILLTLLALGIPIIILLYIIISLIRLGFGFHEKNEKMNDKA